MMEPQIHVHIVMKHLLCVTTTTVTKYNNAFRDDFEDYWTNTLQNMIPKCLHMPMNSNGMNFTVIL